ncbi:M1 family metallopeptidase [Planomicrobium sp. CPCC 101110]|uniref:M1 family metallopeptidase n=1 Tax=Planomicrobium sp. CPCC 101110 TaxID=2599619 RepID=UPI0011B6012E|nr:M1 family metallopeptidase [Planomicrobium sp. CPCC 101110]TWT25357.1 M1 family metallopeptidase [Planomicrobium sp. CPCC 101110]
MKKLLGLALLLLLAFSLSVPVFAAEGPAILQNGTIEVIAGDQESQVTEQLTLSNTVAYTEGTVEHILTNLGTISGLAVTSDGQPLDFQLTEDETLNKVVVTLPEGAADEFTYEISYTFSGAGNRIPLIIPTVSTDGNGNDIMLTVTIPEGQYLQNSFPVIDAGDTGTLTEYMMNIPNFVSLEISSSPPGFFNYNTLFTALGLVIILGFIGAMAFSLFKSTKKTGGSVNV